MTVLVVGKFSGDTESFRRALRERADEFRKFGERARTSGAIHHRFGVGQGFVVAIDEWESVEQLQAFMANLELQAFIVQTGGTGPPELTVTEAVDWPDQF
jgi:hypothetical protein